MSTRYLGLAVGGPADGHRIVHTMTKLHVELQPPSPPLGIELNPRAVIPLDTALTRVTYHWTDCGDMALWLLDNWTIDKAVEHMSRNVGVPALAHLYEQVRLEQKESIRRG